MASGLLRDEMTRIRAPLVADEYGTPGTARDWANATETVIDGCSVQPVSGREYDQGREAVTIRWRVYAPVGSDLAAGDRVRFAGELYEVDGPGRDWPSPTGGLDHVEALLKKVVG